MESAKEIINKFLMNPEYSEPLALVKAARNGAVYGAKVRFPHALVMVFLFRSGTLRQKLLLILKATTTHARNLALFAFLYKSLMYTLRHSPLPLRLPLHQKPRPTGHEAPYDAFLAGLIGGYAVFGRGIQSSVNQQIVTYIFARVVLALAKLSVQQQRSGGIGGVILPGRAWKERASRTAWPVFAALSWGMVMWLFRWHAESVQPSLRSSMQYIYVNADHWDGFRTFFLHNT